MIKKKIISLVFILILTLIGFSNIIMFKINYIDNFNVSRKTAYEFCDNEIEKSAFCQNALEEYNSYKNCLNVKTDACKRVVKNYETFGLDGYSALQEIYIYDEYFIVVVGAVFAFLLFMSWYFSYDLTNLTIKNYLCRESYNKYIFKTYSDGFKFCFSFAYIFLILIVYSFLFTKDYNLFSNINVYKNFFYLILFGMFQINLVFVCSLGSKNFIVCFAKSILAYLSVVFFSAQVSVIIKKIKPIETINIFDLSIKNNINIYLITGLILAILSGFIAYVLFKNKERIISMLEKGDNEYED